MIKKLSPKQREVLIYINACEGIHVGATIPTVGYRRVVTALLDKKLIKHAWDEARQSFVHTPTDAGRAALDGIEAQS